MPTTSPPDTIANACGLNTAITSIDFQFPAPLATVEVSYLGPPGFIDSYIALNDLVDGECVECDEFVQTGATVYMPVTATLDGGDPSLVHVVPSPVWGPPIPAGKEYYFWLRVTAADAPGCPPTYFGPYCFGTACEYPTFTDTIDPDNPAVLPAEGATSPPETTANACNYDGAVITGVDILFNENLAAAPVIVSDGATDGQIGTRAKPTSTTCDDCTDIVPTGFVAATATRDGGNLKLVHVVPTALPLDDGVEFKFYVTVALASSPGCPQTFGPFCFGTLVPA